MATNEEAYAEATQRIRDLTAQLDKFINGTEDENVTLGGKVTPTLRAIVQNMSRVKFTQRIFDFPTVASLNRVLVAYENGMLFRVYAEPPPVLPDDPVNGIYLKKDNAIQKITYQELVDLM